MRKIGQIFRFLIPVIALATLVVFMTGAGRRERAKLEENKAIVRRNLEEFWSTGNMDIVDELYATNFVNHDPNHPDVRDLEGLKKWAKAIFAGLPDFHVTIERMVAEGDMAAERWRVRATHRGDFYGIPPTGKQVAFTGTTIYRIAGGKVVETWWNIDALGIFQQLGFKLAPAEE